MKFLSHLRPWRLASLAALTVLVAGCTAPSTGSSDTRENATLRLHLYAADLVIMSGYALGGDEEVQADMQSALEGMTALVTQMRESGDSARAQKLAPLLAQANAAVTTLSRTALARREAQAAAERSLQVTPQLLARLDELVRAMSAANAPSPQLNIANREIVLADRMSRRITEILRGGDMAVSSADALARDMAVFSQVLDGFRDGGEDLGVARLDSPMERAALDGLENLRAPYVEDVQKVLASGQVLVDASRAIEELGNLRSELLEAAPPRG
jgi:twitching motility protein PilJ